MAAEFDCNLKVAVVPAARETTADAFGWSVYVLPPTWLIVCEVVVLLTKWILALPAALCVKFFVADEKPAVVVLAGSTIATVA